MGTYLAEYKVKAALGTTKGVIEANPGIGLEQFRVLGMKAGYSRITLERALGMLIDEGFIVVDKGIRKNKHYWTGPEELPARLAVDQREAVATMRPLPVVRMSPIAWSVWALEAA